MAEWLRSGLQSRERRFDSGSGLHFQATSCQPLEASMTELNLAAIRVLTDLDWQGSDEEARAILAALFGSDEELTPEFKAAFRQALERGRAGDDSGVQIVFVEGAEGLPASVVKRRRGR